MVQCPICSKSVKEAFINVHLDSGCSSNLHAVEEATSTTGSTSNGSQSNNNAKPKDFAAFFSKSTTSHSPAIEEPSDKAKEADPTLQEQYNGARKYLASLPSSTKHTNEDVQTPRKPLKRSFEMSVNGSGSHEADSQPPKKPKVNAFEKAAPLAERMRPKSLDDVCGQELVGPSGVLRGLVEQDRVPSMILWGGPGTGKTTIARLIARTAGSRFVEINSTSSGVAECKKLFAEAKNELSLTGRKTIIFCDEIHRFSKTQQDVFLGPVEAGHITLIGATTENPSFKVVNALLSRCRTFTLNKLTESDISSILTRALASLQETHCKSSPLLDSDMISYLAAFSDGDARTALNLLELAFDLSHRKNTTKEELKQSLTQTLVYDRAGDQHYDTISAFHKAVRGSDPDAALYYLARMIQSGEDALYIARRMIVIASEDIGLADNTLLPLATAAYAAAEKVGMPEARINLAHVTVALSLAKKSTRAYRGLKSALATIAEPGMAGLPVPLHLRNAPTRLMRQLDYGKAYKYNPDYKDGKIAQDYLPEKLIGRKFLEDHDLGQNIDPDLDHR